MSNPQPLEDIKILVLILSAVDRGTSNRNRDENLVSAGLEPGSEEHHGRWSVVLFTRE